MAKEWIVTRMDAHPGISVVVHDEGFVRAWERSHGTRRAATADAAERNGTDPKDVPVYALARRERPIGDGRPLFEFVRV